MSKKDFIALADAIRSYGFTTEDGRRVIEIDDLAHFCQSQNNRFMRERWLSYIAGKCGKNGGKVAA